MKISTDCEIGEALAADDHAEANALCDDAVAETRAVLAQLNHIRDNYSAILQSGLGNLRADGVDPAEVAVADDLLIPA